MFFNEARKFVPVQKMSEPGKNLSDLPAMRIQISIGPDDKIGAGDFLVNRHLRGDALLDFFRSPAAFQKSFLLVRGGTGDANDFFKLRFGLRFIQQRNDDDGQFAILPAPSFNLREPTFADARMKDGLEFFARGMVGKNDAGKFVAAQLAVGGDDVFTEFILDFRQCNFSWLDKLAREFIGVNDLRARGAEKIRSGGFAHPHAAGQATDFHRSYGPLITR